MTHTRFHSTYLVHPNCLKAIGIGLISQAFVFLGVALAFFRLHFDLYGAEIAKHIAIDSGFHAAPIALIVGSVMIATFQTKRGNMLSRLGNFVAANCGGIAGIVLAILYIIIVPVH